MISSTGKSRERIVNDMEQKIKRLRVASICFYIASTMNSITAVMNFVSRKPALGVVYLLSGSALLCTAGCITLKLNKMEKERKNNTDKEE